MKILFEISHLDCHNVTRLLAHTLPNVSNAFSLVYILSVLFLCKQNEEFWWPPSCILLSHSPKGAYYFLKDCNYLKAHAYC